METKKRELSEKSKSVYKKLYYASEIIFLPVYLCLFIISSGEQYGVQRFLIIILALYSSIRIFIKRYYRKFEIMAESMLNIKRNNEKLADYSVYGMLAITVIIKIILIALIFGLV